MALYYALPNVIVRVGPNLVPTPATPTSFTCTHCLTLWTQDAYLAAHPYPNALSAFELCLTIPCVRCNNCVPTVISKTRPVGSF